MKITKHQEAKCVVLNYFDEIENASNENVGEILKVYTSEDYQWFGVYPFLEQKGWEAVTKLFWAPLKKSMTGMQRRQDIFIGGENDVTKGEIWVLSMGHFMGQFDAEYLGIRPTGKMMNIRYAEFNCVSNKKITKTGLFLDLIGLMEQANCYPLPPSTGKYFVYPGPRKHNGLLFEDAAPEEGVVTLKLVNKMIDDLSTLNNTGSMGCPPEILEKSWSKNMIWYGPSGIGASYMIPNYQKQHQLPFRNNLKDKKFNGHVCRFAEGNFACFFGWPNLTNTPTGGFLGMPGGKVGCHMNVVDIYNREGDKLSENWVFIDLPYWLYQQGLDVFKRTSSILNP